MNWIISVPLGSKIKTVLLTGEDNSTVESTVTGGFVVVGLLSPQAESRSKKAKIEVNIGVFIMFVIWLIKYTKYKEVKSRVGILKN